MFVDGGLTMGQILTKVQAIQAKFLGKLTIYVDTFLHKIENGEEVTLIHVSFLIEDKDPIWFEFRDWSSSDSLKKELKRLEEFIKTL